MILCRKCAHLVGPTTLRCPRCNWSWPYYRSRRWRRGGLGVPGIRFGKRCRHCGERTSRQRTPLWLKPLRTLTGQRCSLRRCLGCHWRGIAFHAPSRAGRSHPITG
ncbi:MAG TPA: hypothetical protein VFX98_01510 [Longimicrobiaceae bacterium]|nr:hypothetical protein [Longimicrobiaceae bacterium]